MGTEETLTIADMLAETKYYGLEVPLILNNLVVEIRGKKPELAENIDRRLRADCNFFKMVELLFALAPTFVAASSLVREEMTVESLGDLSEDPDLAEIASHLVGKSSYCLFDWAQANAVSDNIYRSRTAELFA